MSPNSRNSGYTAPAVQSFYEMLDVAPTAPIDEIKRAFRREIAKYHPDKVQHLGREFQEIAATKASELTQAYKILCDDEFRADYDVQLRSGTAGGRASDAAPAAPKARQTSAQPAEPRPSERTEADAESQSSSARATARSQDRVGVSDIVRKAAVMRFRQAIRQEFGQCDEVSVPGFDVSVLPPKGGFFSRTVPPRMLGRFVPQVDAASVQESWAMASRLKRDDQRDVCVFLMGPAVAPAGELGRAITEQRRKVISAGIQLFVVPVNTRAWTAHIPHDAPPVVKALVARLQSG